MSVAATRAGGMLTAQQVNHLRVIRVDAWFLAGFFLLCMYFMERLHRVFASKFRQEVVRQVTEPGRVARELDWRPVKLRQWRRQSDSARHTVLAGLLLLGCTTHLPQGVDQRLVEELRRRSPEEQFEKFLSFSMVTRHPTTRTSPLELMYAFLDAWEDPDGQISYSDTLDRVRWLANYQVLSVELNPTSDSPGSDLAKATAVITTVTDESGALECRPADPAVAKEPGDAAPTNTLG